VVDASHPGFAEQAQVADRTLNTIRGAELNTLYVFNKIDAVDRELLEGLKKRYPDAAFISARRQIGIDALEERMHEILLGRALRVEVKIPVSDGKGIALVKSLLKDQQTSLEDGLCVLVGTIQSELSDDLERVSGARVRYLL
jgi:GTP-binding protein HflX